MARLFECIKKDKRRTIFALLTGIVFSLFLNIGYTLNEFDKLPLSNLLFWISIIILSFILSFLCFIILGFKGFSFLKNNAGTEMTVKKRKLIILCSVTFMLVSWLIQLIGVYPGFFNYDAPQQWLMYAESAVTAHHPVIHTYLVGLCLHLSFLVWKSALPGCFIYLCIQMLITVYAYSSFLSFLLKRNFRLAFIVLSVLWFSFSPTCVMCLLSVTKDSLFTPFLILFILSCFDFLGMKDGEKFGVKRSIRWYVAAFFAAILRNNALYIMIPVMVFLIIRYRKKVEVLGFIGVIALIFLYLGPFTKSVTVEGVKEREYLSVPAQQIMRIYHLHKEELSKSEIDLIENTFEVDALKLYVPKIADVAKGSIKKDFFDEHRKEIASLWTDLLKRYPREYVEAFLLGNSGFWYPWTTLVLNANGGEGYYVCKAYSPVWDDSKIVPIYDYYRHYENANIVCNNPLTMWIFAPATYFFLFFLTMIYLLYQKRKEAMPLVVVFLIWLTFLLGPVALVRYVGFLYTLVPVEIALLAREDKTYKDVGC